MPTGGRRQIVIVGAGFGGLTAAKELAGSSVDVVLIDRHNYHVFSPLLYQVASAALSPGDIAHPIRAILRSADNVRVMMSTVTAIDATRKTVVTDDGVIEYDALILAPGTRHSYFGHDEWEEFAPGLKDLNDALRIRERMLTAFEDAAEVVGSAQIAPLLTFVAVGGGPTGVEMAGSMAEIGLRTMLPDFPRLKRSDIRIVLVEGGNRLLAAFDPSLSERTRKDLVSLGVDVRLNTVVKNVTAEGVELGDGSFIEARNVIWAAGNVASPLLQQLDAACDRSGRVLVNEDCSVPGHGNIYVIGDAANFRNDAGATLPGVCQTAIQQGTFVAKLLRDHFQNAPHKKFVYFDKGNMATIGRAKAVAEIGGMKLSGIVAWFLWATIHIFYLIGFRKRIRVFVEWLWYYVTFQPGARLITESGKRQRSVKLHP